MMSPLLQERLTTNTQCVNSATPVALNAALFRMQKKKRVVGDPDHEIWLTPSTK
jgi:hypothetical protein